MSSVSWRNRSWQNKTFPGLALLLPEILTAAPGSAPSLGAPSRDRGLGVLARGVLLASCLEQNIRTITLRAEAENRFHAEQKFAWISRFYHVGESVRKDDLRCVAIEGEAGQDSRTGTWTLGFILLRRSLLDLRAFCLWSKFAARSAVL